MTASLMADLVGIAILFFGAVLAGMAGLLCRPTPPVLRNAPWVLAGSATLAGSMGTTYWAWLLPLGIGGIYLVFFARRAPLASRRSAGLGWGLFCWSGLLVAGPILSMIWVESLCPVPIWQVNPAYEEAGKAVLLQRAQVSAVSDTGAPIELYQPAEVIAKELLCEHDAALTKGFQNHLIRTDQPGIASNCHGWVFTDGKFWVRCQDVDRILKENGYKIVTVAQPGDIVVYRDGWGGASHSGIIRTVTNEFELVESKWGKAGRYLHVAQHSCYGVSFHFYRAERAGHILRGLDDSSSRAV